MEKKGWTWDEEHGWIRAPERAAKPLSERENKILEEAAEKAFGQAEQTLGVAAAKEAHKATTKPIGVLIAGSPGYLCALVSLLGLELWTIRGKLLPPS